MSTIDETQITYLASTLYTIGQERHGHDCRATSERHGRDMDATAQLPRDCNLQNLRLVSFKLSLAVPSWPMYKCRSPPCSQSYDADRGLTRHRASCRPYQLRQNQAAERRVQIAQERKRKTATLRLHLPEVSHDMCYWCPTNECSFRF